MDEWDGDCGHPILEDVRLDASALQNAAEELRGDRILRAA